jgi:RecB family exonuclease
MAGDTFIESDHNRNRRGEFTEKLHTAPAGSLGEPLDAPPVAPAETVAEEAPEPTPVEQLDARLTRKQLRKQLRKERRKARRARRFVSVVRGGAGLVRAAYQDLKNAFDGIF